MDEFIQAPTEAYPEDWHGIQPKLMPCTRYSAMTHATHNKDR